ncbi:MAG: polysaccharide biosynthesis C-terminal domain-containing protein, partial [Clostridia bacterium]|nr:polysaccharide biosynthesis C-terminal domain-containing protein [Clostridia bacterium]
LLFYAVGIVAYGSLQLLNRAFYAVQDTATPMLVGMFTIALNIWLNLILIGRLGHGGLALAYSLAGIFNMVLLLFLLRRRLGPMGGRRLALSAAKSLVAALLAASAAWTVAGRLEPQVLLLGKLGQVQQVGAALAVALGVFLLAAVALRMEETGQAWQLVRRRLGR